MSDLVPDRPVQRWLRRAVTVPAYAAAALAAWATLPLTLPLALVADLMRRRGLVATRTVLFFAWYFACDLLGLAVALALWIVYRLTPAVDRARFLDWNFALELAWAAALFRGGSRLFDLRFEIEGEEEAREAVARPVLLFIRHASTADVLLPAMFVSRPHGLRLRYVLKRELLWEPCLDVVGQRLPNIFVRRDSRDPSREIALVRALANGLGPGEGVLLYPEGTRFTPEKQARAVARLAESSPDLHARAKGLRHVLPPKLGGALALLDDCPDADVLFLAHAGLDGVRTVREFAAGRLIGLRVNVCLWRVPASEIPTGPERVAWLYDQWERVDEWIARQR